MPESINCFIPAAGLGERLRPLTNHIPKPLLPLPDRPLLEDILRKVTALSPLGIGINIHHKGELIEEWLASSPHRDKVSLFPEDPILDTGGALKNAESLLRGAPFLVYNGDIVSDIDLEKLISLHFSSGNLATLAVHDYPRFNNVRIDAAGLVTGVGSSRLEGETQVAFTGIAVYSPEFLDFLPPGKSGVVEAWLKAAAAGQRIGTVDFTGCRWSDIGTPSAYAAAVIDALRSRGEAVFVHPLATGCSRAALDGFVVIGERCVIDAGVGLRNCIVLPKSRPEKGLHENCLIGPDFKIRLEGREMGLAAEDGTVLIGAGGSDRRYFRVKKDSGSSVLMQCAAGDPDYRRQLDYSRFFRQYGIPVPEVGETDPEGMRAFFEDLGDLSLYGWLKCPRDAVVVERMYRDALDILVRLQTSVTAHVEECPLLAARVFNYEHLRWETGYFMERFVQGYANIIVKDGAALDKEFHRLAALADSFPKTIVHRDFQSQNIMIDRAGSPRVIDYQGARMGPPAYDAVSLLRDPYYRLDNAARKRLEEYYTEMMKSATGGMFDAATLLPCALQRHMQALGAYGFLSMVKGKKYFLKHIPEALRLLGEELYLVRDVYPELYKLVEEALNG